MKSNSIIIKEFDLARQILSSSDFIGVNITRHLDGIKQHHTHSFTYLSKYASISLPFLDGDEHRYIRKKLAPLFSTKTVRNRNDILHRIVDRAFQAFLSADEPDLVQNFTDEIYLNMVEEYIGIQIDDRQEFLSQVSIATLLVEPLLSISSLKKVDDSYRKLSEMIGDLSVHPPSNTVIGHLLNDADLDLTSDQIQTVITILAVAGHTMTESLSNVLLALSRTGKEYMEQMKNPEWVEDHIEHFIRLFASTEYLSRESNKDQIIQGCPVSRGDKVFLYIPDINRDEKMFHGKNDLKSIVDAKPQKHMSFGAGQHVCPGNFLSHELFVLILNKYANTFKNVSIAEDKIIYNTTTVAKRLKSLPVSSFELN